jgi:hypothetical protein
MATALIKFEVRLPLDDGNGTPIDVAIQTFLSSLSALVALSDISDVYQTISSSISQYNLVFGLLTNAQAATALGYLNTLNASLIAAGGTTVVCYTYNVTTQP